MLSVYLPHRLDVSYDMVSAGLTDEVRQEFLWAMMFADTDLQYK